MSFELISADIDASLNIRQAEYDDNMNSSFSELVGSVERLRDTITYCGGHTKELFYARNLEDNLTEFVNSLGNRSNTDVWHDLLKRLRMNVDEAAVADKENEEPGKKNGKNLKGKNKKRNTLKRLPIHVDESSVDIKDNHGPSLKNRCHFPKEKDINRKKKSSTKEKVRARVGLSQDENEQEKMGEGSSSMRGEDTGNGRKEWVSSEDPDGIVSFGSSTS